jgi:hypothetical protein
MALWGAAGAGHGGKKRKVWISAGLPPPSGRSRVLAFTRSNRKTMITTVQSACADACSRSFSQG